MWGIDTLPEPNAIGKSNNPLTEKEAWDFSVNTFKEDLDYWSKRMAPGCLHYSKLQFDAFTAYFEEETEGRVSPKSPTTTSIPIEKHTHELTDPTVSEKQTDTEFHDESLPEAAVTHFSNSHTSVKSSKSIRSVKSTYSNQSHPSPQVTHTHSHPHVRSSHQPETPSLRGHNPLKSLKRVFSRQKSSKTSENKSFNEKMVPGPSNNRKSSSRRNVSLDLF
ncbi:hypothetical protein BDF14DRAFT_634013 [Spinellus fusiger]|nr:hypothetical protein BDF14DRAFT_634013 [Spinellus fusiger]